MVPIVPAAAIVAGVHQQHLMNQQQTPNPDSLKHVPMPTPMYQVRHPLPGYAHHVIYISSNHPSIDNYYTYDRGHGRQSEEDEDEDTSDISSDPSCKKQPTIDTPIHGTPTGDLPTDDGPSEELSTTLTDVAKGNVDG